MNLSNKIICLLCAVICFQLSSAIAQEDLIKKSSPDLDVAIVYHKLNKTFPDFEKWATYSQDVVTAPEEEKARVAKLKVPKLELAFSQYNYLTKPLVIRAVVTVSLGQDKKSEAPLLSINFDNQENAFFTYQYADYNYAVIAEKLDVLKKIPISLVEARYIAERLPRDGQVLLVMDVVPYRTSNEQGLKQDKVSYRGLFTKVGGLSLYNSDLALVWGWEADWVRQLRSVSRQEAL